MDFERLSVSQDKEKPTTTPTLVAHRGYASRYPENTIAGLVAAFEVGAGYVELDVQLSADHIPVVIHDADLQRTAGIRKSALDLPYSGLQQIEVNEVARLGDTFSGIFVASLAETLERLAEWPERSVFVEIKHESIRKFGRELTVKSVARVVASAQQPCIVISFDMESVRLARQLGVKQVGWVVDAWSGTAHELTKGLAPDFLFCDWRKVPPPPTDLWSGRWHWAMYEITTVEMALEWHARGAAFIETMAIGELIVDPRLRAGATS